MTVLLLGTDIVYSDAGGKLGNKMSADPASFRGRADTILLARLDPIRNTISVLSIPRDTEVEISGYGIQKINAANAIGGPVMARDVVSAICGIPVDHYVVLNVHGLVEFVDELGGITVDIPKPMRYMDWTAKLKIDLEPGMHTLTGNQAMGFVRFRHDALGDIGRVQRQEIFLRAVMERAMRPESLQHIPALLNIAKSYVLTDMSDSDIWTTVNFVRAVPRENRHLVMLPGRFAGGSGNWLVDENDMHQVVSRMEGNNWPEATKADVKLVIQNASGLPNLGGKLAKILREKGYTVVAVTDASQSAGKTADSTHVTKIIAQRDNPEDAAMVKADLSDHGQIVNASVGDIQSTITIMVGDDLQSLVEKAP